MSPLHSQNLLPAPWLKMPTFLLPHFLTCCSFFFFFFLLIFSVFIFSLDLWESAKKFVSIQHEPPFHRGMCLHLCFFFPFSAIILSLVILHSSSNPVVSNVWYILFDWNSLMSDQWNHLEWCLLCFQLVCPPHSLTTWSFSLRWVMNFQCCPLTLSSQPWQPLVRVLVLEMCKDSPSTQWWYWPLDLQLFSCHGGINYSVEITYRLSWMYDPKLNFSPP